MKAYYDDGQAVIYCGVIHPLALEAINDWKTA